MLMVPSSANGCARVNPPALPLSAPGDDCGDAGDETGPRDDNPPSGEVNSSTRAVRAKTGPPALPLSAPGEDGGDAGDVPRMPAARDVCVALCTNRTET